MEPEGAQAHYTERLVRLPNLALNVSPPRLPAAPRTRPALGLPPEGVLYLSSQSLFKYLPDHDDIYPRIAREVPEARFIFIAHRQPGITRRFRARLDRAFRAFGLDAGRYCHFQPQRAYEDFLSVNLRCDILLDTLEWSGGKTTLEAIACGLPVVTLPGRFMRGRHAYAMLAMMGIRETVAADKEAYIRIAAALGSDAGAREQARRLLAERRDRLYGDTRFMRALEDFLAAEVERRT
jgi:predicted O-linked N-acetylglucosamine transferase (SPINDLY family)